MFRRQKKRKRKGQSTNQSSHYGQSNPALRQSEDEENRLENNEIRVINASIIS